MASTLPSLSGRHRQRHRFRRKKRACRTRSACSTVLPPVHRDPEPAARLCHRAVLPTCTSVHQVEPRTSSSHSSALAEKLQATWPIASIRNPQRSCAPVAWISSSIRNCAKPSFFTSPRSAAARTTKKAFVRRRFQPDQRLVLRPARRISCCGSATAPASSTMALMSNILRGVNNPIGVKCRPVSMNPDDLMKPDRRAQPGQRSGAPEPDWREWAPNKVGDHLPQLIQRGAT